MTVTEQQLSDILSTSLGRQAKPSDTWADLGVDSMAIAEVLSEVETRFGVRLDERVFEFNSVAEMAAFLDRQRAAH